MCKDFGAYAAAKISLNSVHCCGADWHEVVVGAIIRTHLIEEGVHLEHRETPEWFLRKGLIGPIQSSWMFLRPGRPLTKHQCHDLPSSKFYCDRMLNGKEPFPDVLILCTKSMWPLDNPIIQHAIALDRLVCVSDNPGDYMQTARAVASLSRADSEKVRAAIQRHRRRLFAKRQERHAQDNIID